VPELVRRHGEEERHAQHDGPEDGRRRLVPLADDFVVLGDGAGREVVRGGAESGADDDACAGAGDSATHRRKPDKITTTTITPPRSAARPALRFAAVPVPATTVS